VAATSVAHNLKEHYPSAKISFLVESSAQELFINNPYVDEVICYDAPWFSRYPKRKLNFCKFSSLLKKLRRQKYDLGFDLRGDARHILMMRLAGVKFTVGYGSTGAGFLLNRNAQYHKDMHTVERNLYLLKIIGIPVKFSSPEIYFNKQDINFVDNLLKDLGYNKNNSLVLHPYAGSKAKAWSEEKFKLLIADLKLNKWDIFIVGTTIDTPSYAKVIDLRGRLNLAQLAYFIKSIGFFIGLDSGPANIAAALNVRTLVICSGTNIAEYWIPTSNNVKLIYKEVKCRPCEQTTCPKEKHYCMEAITVEEVMDVVDRLLG
jgi:ADP-heptose:LPS heptosyltransferase